VEKQLKTDKKLPSYCTIVSRNKTEKPHVPNVRQQGALLYSACLRKITTVCICFIPLVTDENQLTTRFRYAQTSGSVGKTKYSKRATTQGPEIPFLYFFPKNRYTMRAEPAKSLLSIGVSLLYNMLPALDLSGF